MNALNWSVTNEATNKTCVILDADSVDLFVKFTDIKASGSVFFLPTYKLQNHDHI